MRGERWLPLGAGLTILLAAVPLANSASYPTLLGALTLFPLWMFAAFALSMAVTIPAILRMMIRGVPNPIAVCREWLVKERSRLLVLVLGIALCGLNMITFMWAKPVLNHLVPFWADPLLADIDRAIFGFDPAFHPAFLNTNGFALFYHRGWFAMMIAVLVLVLFQPASARKNALLTTYFLLWSVVGPLVHSLLPAGGPIFYERLGYGARFAEASAPQTTALADYLWRIYGSTTFGPGAGISAMPSLHIATTAWVVFAVWLFARRWVVPTAIGGMLIFILSVSLGWHYAVDGLVGGGLMLCCFALCRRWFGEQLEQPTAAILPADLPPASLKAQ